MCVSIANSLLSNVANLLMGANIALLHYYYDVSFDRKMHVNEQSNCKLYKLQSDSEQCATVGVLRELLNCKDGINVI